MQKLKKFEAWRETAKIQLEGLGFIVTYFDSPPSGNLSKWIHFKKNDIEATIAVWEHGDIVPEAYIASLDKFIEIERLDNCQVSLEEVCQKYLDGIIKSGGEKEK